MNPLTRIILVIILAAGLAPASAHRASNVNTTPKTDTVKQKERPPLPPPPPPPPLPPRP